MTSPVPIAARLRTFIAEWRRRLADHLLRPGSEVILRLDGDEVARLIEARSGAEQEGVQG